MDILQEYIKQEHRRREIESLDAGYDGCGCLDCQDLYREIDLERYGSRVRRFQDTIIIAAGPAVKPVISPDTRQQTRTPEKPANNESFFKSVCLVNVTGTAKVPYHRKGQSTLYDADIDTAIVAGGGYRRISKALEARGIKISHMSIKRRIEERKL